VVVRRKKRSLLQFKMGIAWRSVGDGLNNTRQREIERPTHQASGVGGGGGGVGGGDGLCRRRKNSSMTTERGGRVLLSVVE